MGFRFQKRLTILPDVRINLSRRGASTSIGPRGADVNIGQSGISANAGIPGTGLSYRTRLAKPGSAWIGVLALLAGLGFAAWKNMERIGHLFAPAPVVQQTSVQPATTPTTETANPATAAATPTARPKPASVRAQAAKLLVPGGTIYVRRAGSVLRETEKASGKTLKKLEKGAPVTVVAVDNDWTQVKDGDATGWMRTSVLGPKP